MTTTRPSTHETQPSRNDTHFYPSCQRARAFLVFFSRCSLESPLCLCYTLRVNDHVNDNGNRRKASVTIRDVAERAGVSRQTVSRAMNNKGEIRPETRERILEIARTLGYRPNSIARSLKTDRTLTIGLVVPDIANPFFAEVVRGASEVAYGLDYSVLLCNTDEHPEREWAVLRTLEAHRVDGLILVSSRLSDETLQRAIEAWRPMVIVNRFQPPRPGLGCVLVNDAQAAVTAARHLISRGHRCIGWLGGSPASHSGLERRQGYIQAMAEAKLQRKEGWCVSCTPNVRGGREATGELLANHPEVTALLAYNDLVAVGAQQACQTLGRAIPDQLALVGWDDIAFASYVVPPLTTMRMPKYRIGERAMSLLFDLIRNPTLMPEISTLDAALVVRGST